MKKFWIIILVLLALAGGATAVYYIWFHKEWVEPQILEPEVFNNFDKDLLIGLWREDEVYYRYKDDGTAVTWDIDDDVMEDEGTELDWTLEDDVFTHLYKMEIGGTVPKIYTMKVLDLDTMKYEDNFGVRHVFAKVEELQLIQ